MRAAWSLLISVGCPYIWHPPPTSDDGLAPTGADTPNSDADTDSDVDSDADTDTDADADSGPTADTWPLGDPPEVAQLEARLRFDHIELSFRLLDPDGDLEGGTVSWTDNGAPRPPLPIPGGLDTWDPATGVGTVVAGSVTRNCSIDPLGFDYGIVPVDAAGNRGGQGDVALEIAVRSGISDGQDLGVLGAPAIVCGTLEINDKQHLVDFTSGPGGSWRLTLDHDVGWDIDLALQDGGTIASATTANNPDTTTATLMAGHPYALEVGRQQQNSAQGYVVTFHE